MKKIVCSHEHNISKEKKEEFAKELKPFYFAIAAQKSKRLIDYKDECEDYLFPLLECIYSDINCTTFTYSTKQNGIFESGFQGEGWTFLRFVNFCQALQEYGMFKFVENGKNSTKVVELDVNLFKNKLIDNFIEENNEEFNEFIPNIYDTTQINPEFSFSSEVSHILGSALNLHTRLSVDINEVISSTMKNIAEVNLIFENCPEVFKNEILNEVRWRKQVSTSGTNIVIYIRDCFLNKRRNWLNSYIKVTSKEGEIQHSCFTIKNLEAHTYFPSNLEEKFSYVKK